MLQVSLLVRRELIERARDFNIILDDVSITELSFGKEYTAAVESKQVGTRFSIITTILMLNPYQGLLNQIFLKDSYTLSSLRWPHVSVVLHSDMVPHPWTKLAMRCWLHTRYMHVRFVLRHWLGVDFSHISDKFVMRCGLFMYVWQVFIAVWTAQMCFIGLY